MGSHSVPRTRNRPLAGERPQSWGPTYTSGWEEAYIDRAVRGSALAASVSSGRGRRTVNTSSRLRGGHHPVVLESASVHAWPWYSIGSYRVFIIYRIVQDIHNMWNVKNNTLRHRNIGLSGGTGDTNPPDMPGKTSFFPGPSDSPCRSSSRGPIPSSVLRS